MKCWLYRVNQLVYMKLWSYVMTKQIDNEETCCKKTCCADGCCSGGCKTGKCSESCCSDGCCSYSVSCCTK